VRDNIDVWKRVIPKIAEKARRRIDLRKICRELNL